MIESTVLWLLNVLALPKVGLSSVFIVSFIAATLIPMGSEPVVFAAIKANSTLFWPVILFATAGNTLGGIVNYWLGYGAKQIFVQERRSYWLHWLERGGAKMMLLAWLPIVGDPICSLGGWLKLPFWPSFVYMAIGKILRYIMMIWLLLNVPDGIWRQIGQWLV